MKSCTCFLLFRILAYTISSPLNTPKEPKKDPYLALKGALELNTKNVFKATEEPVIDDHKILQPKFREPRVETFTDFIQGVANILNTYEDIAFTDFFDILDKEIRKYHYKGCKFYELTENNYELRSVLAQKFDLLKRKSVPVLKANINIVLTIIRHGTYGKNVNDLLEYINSLYREDAREKFRKVLLDLKAYGNSKSERPKNYLVKIIRDGVRAIIFDHYTDLNINVRRAMNKEIATFLKKMNDAPSSSSKTNLFPYKTAFREPKNTVKIYEYNIAIEDGNPEHYSKIDPTSTAENKDIFIVKASDEKHQQEEATKLETSKEENNSQQLQMTYLSTDESSDETIEGNSLELSPERQQQFNSQSYATQYTKEISCKTTEKSGNMQIMLVEESTGRLPTVQPTTTPKLRYMSDEDLRRRIASPLPEEEQSIDVFDRDERQRQKSLAKSNSIATVEYGIKHYIKRMRNVNKLNPLKKIYENNPKSRNNVISNGYKVKNIGDEYEAKNSKNKVREPKRDDKKTNSVNEDGQGRESNKEIVKSYNRHAYLFKNKKKITRSEATKATKSVKSVNIPVHRSMELLPTANNDAGSTTANDNNKILTKTTSTITKKVGNAILNVTEEKQKRIDNNATYDYAQKDDTTHRYRRVLEFSSPPFYDQPFDDHKIRDRLLDYERSSVLSLTRPRIA